MEEQVLKILQKSIYYSNQHMIRVNPLKGTSKEITAHVMEFALWLACDSFNFFESGTDEEEQNYFSNMEGEKVSLNDVYLYWFENINNK